MSEIMSAAKLHMFPTIALVIFLTTFALLMWAAFRPSARASQKHIKQAVLDGEVLPSGMARTMSDSTKAGSKESNAHVSGGAL
ncbi:MAG: hypothetical protein MUE97_02200 [Phycisphaerales bacterium]|nr:hypothetical protein [Phycisphaerales bacterium]